MNRLDLRGVDDTVALYALNCGVATACAGLKACDNGWWQRDGAAGTVKLPDYATRPDLVIPLIEQCGVLLDRCFWDDDDKDWTMGLFGSPVVSATSFAVAACIMLLQERGWEIIR